ncbi:MAG: GTP cyclohydrolase I [Alistipes shahii]
MVLVKGTSNFTRCCEHHERRRPGGQGPRVAYVPNGHIAGLSKIARVVEWLSPAACRLQERLTCAADPRLHPGGAQSDGRERAVRDRGQPP